LAERDVADGRNLSAWGPYDLNLEMYSTAMPMGYYKNYRSGVNLKQAVYRGGYVYSGYRIGRDDVQPWYKERLTNDAGEFKVGAGIPLFQGREIDKYRAEVMASEVARAAVEPGIQAELLQFVLAASDAYWSWVAAGKMLDAQQQLLRLAITRVEQIEERVKAGDLEQIAVIDNQRLIASRETKLIESERKLQAAAIKLSLFLRDESGAPRVADSDRLPAEFPPLQTYDAEQLPSDIEQAYTARPELRYLDLQIQEIEIELAAAENMLQPRIDARLEASKDVGARADPKGDKTPFELEAGIWGEVPLQRRQACGKIQSLQGKMTQLAAKRQYSADKVATEVRDAVSAIEAAAGRIQRARTTADLARQSLNLGRQGFESGDLTVVTLNLYEQAVLDADLQLIEAQADYFKARAAYRAAIGASLMEVD
jgi:outer membrane protein TolC